MDTLPRIKQVHYAAEDDKTVPVELIKKWVSPNNLIIIPDAKHNLIPGLKIDFE
jgi:hypothetical protein